MPSINPGFGPRWIATNLNGTVRPAHAKADAEAFERGEIAAATLDARNAEIEASPEGLDAFYESNP